jgi:hypothetical protein
MFNFTSYKNMPGQLERMKKSILTSILITSIIAIIIGFIYLVGLVQGFKDFGERHYSKSLIKYRINTTISNTDSMLKKIVERSEGKIGYGPANYDQSLKTIFIVQNQDTVFYNYWTIKNTIQISHDTATCIVLSSMKYNNEFISFDNFQTNEKTNINRVALFKSHIIDQLNRN